MKISKTAGFVHRRRCGREWCHTAHGVSVGESSDLHQTADLTPCAVWHHSRPHRRLWTIPAVLDIYMPRSARSATRSRGPGSRLRSPAISRNLSRRDCVELTGDRGRSQSRPRTHRASEWLSVEIEAFRYPKRPGSSIGDDVAENGAKRRMGYQWSNRAICTQKPI